MRRAFTLIEVLVALAVLLAGLLLAAAMFPTALKGAQDAELLTQAAALAQLKAEEIRRDDSVNRELFAAIVARTTPTDPIKFLEEPRLAYSFSGRSLLFPGGPTSSDPRAAAGPARVIIRYAADFRPTQDVIYELRFGEN